MNMMTEVYWQRNFIFLQLSTLFSEGHNRFHLFLWDPFHSVMRQHSSPGEVHTSTENDVLTPPV
jgi:hypothetical protein